MFYLGIDPGKEGALVALNDHVPHLIIDCPTFKIEKPPSKRKRKPVLDENGKPKRKKEASRTATKIDPHGIYRVLGDLKRESSDIVCVMEWVSEMPGNMGMFQFGEGVGYWKMALVAHDIPFTLHVPQRWKKVMLPGLPHNDKIVSMEQAAQMFPDHSHLLLGPKGGPLDGRAEALLLAEYARRLHLGQAA